MEEEPLKNGENGEKGRDPQTGRFIEGYQGGPGRPSKTDYQRAYEELLFELVSKEDKPIIEKLIARAKGGDVTAIKEINDRILGRSVQPLNIGGQMDNPLRLIEVVKPDEPNNSTI